MSRARRLKFGIIGKTQQEREVPTEELKCPQCATAMVYSNSQEFRIDDEATDTQLLFHEPGWKCPNCDQQCLDQAVVTKINKAAEADLVRRGIWPPVNPGTVARLRRGL